MSFYKAPLRLICLAGAATALLTSPPTLVGQQAEMSSDGAAEVPRLRDLICRGGTNPSPLWGIPALRLEVVQNPSEDSPPSVKFVKMKLTYEAHASRPPGSCYWPSNNAAGSPPPGVVYFDIEAVSPRAPKGDTSANAALAYVDTSSLRRYLTDPGHYWVFYHMHPSPRGVFGAPFAEIWAPASPAAMGIAVAPTPAVPPTGTSTLTQARERNPTGESQGTRAAAGTTVQTASPSDGSGSSAATGDSAAAGSTRVSSTRLEFVAVHATRDHFKLEFRATPGVPPVVQYSLERPFRRSQGARWRFGTPLPATVVERSTGTETARYQAVPRVRLQPDTRYFFVITVPAAAPGEKPAQYRGDFRTRE